MAEENEIYAALRRHFGFEEFREGQLAPVKTALEGRDAVVVMPTGSGKSLCYQLAALMLPGTTLVVSPLIALMKDQVAALERRGIKAAFINSTLAPDEIDYRIASMEKGEYKLVYIAPERFRSEAFRRAVSRTELALLTIDEAHCISQWGHDFRPDYLDIRDALKGFPDIPVMAVTATATPEVRKDIIAQLGLGVEPRGEPYVQVQGFARENLHLSVVETRGQTEKMGRVAALVKQYRTGIVYVATRKHAAVAYGGLKDLAGEFPESTILLYHGGMDDRERTKVYNEFVAAKYPVVVATNAFGMGVDRADIRFVAHWDIPGSVEAYYQEVGRAGRDGLPSVCELCWSWADVKTQEYFIDGGNPSVELARDVLLRVKDGRGKFVELDDAEDIAKWNGTNAIAVETALNVMARHGAVEMKRTGYREAPEARYTGAAGDAEVLKVFRKREKKRQMDERRLRSMISFCTGGGCRHKYILKYFGEEVRADVCGGCDRCGTKPPPPPLTEEQWVVVQKVLSCIGRTGGERNAETVVDVLTGVRSEEVSGAGLDGLSTWNLLAGHDAELLRTLVEALVRSGCASLSADGKALVKLTAKGVRVAKREEPEFTVRWPEAGRKRRRRAAVQERARKRGGDEDFGAELGEAGQKRALALRKWRAEAAKAAGVAAFWVMSNKTLFDIARRDPRTLEELKPLVFLKVLNAYGEEIIGVLRGEESTASRW